jgi:DNA polymerase II small subunit/DNA polymerase delta subunit B
MGCYDMIVANCVCPYCGKVDRIVLDQTKDFSCTFRDLSLGDLCVDSYYAKDFCTDTGDHECEACKKTYGYAVDFQQGFMTKIEVIDKIFNKRYSYVNPSDIQEKEMTEAEFKDKVQYLNKLKEILQHNQSTITRLENTDKNIEDKIKVLSKIINDSVSNLFK